MGSAGLIWCAEQWNIKEKIQNTTAKQQIAILENTLENRCEANFVLYKNKVWFWHDNYILHKESFKNRELDPEQKWQTILAVAEPWWVIRVNSDVDPSDIPEHLLLHEFSHARKDSVERQLDHEFSDHSAKVISINWRWFKLKNKDGSEQWFPILEEAAAEYIAASFNKHNNRFNPWYFALLTWMRHLEKTKKITPQQVAKAIDEDDYTYIINMCDLEEKDNRAEKIFIYVSKIYRLPINKDWYPENDLNEVEARVKKFIQENPSP